MANAKLISQFTELQRQSEARLNARLDEALTSLWVEIRDLQHREQGRAEAHQEPAQAAGGGVENQARGEVQEPAEADDHET
jgi:hypothetical protein